MKSITDKLKETIQMEEAKNSKDRNYVEIEQLFDELRKMGLLTKPDYTFPIVDTMGKHLYSSLHEQKPL